MFKKQYALFLLFILAIPIVNSMNLRIDNDVNNKTLSLLNIDDSDGIKNKIVEYDPRGYLTGRMFFEGFMDLEPDGIQDFLLLNVEVNITQTLANPVIVYALLYDNSFVKETSYGWREEGMTVWGNSTIQSLPMGVHNVTVLFNTTLLRILKLPGPYMIFNVKLGEVGSDFFSELDSWDWEKPLFRISRVFDIWTYAEPRNTSDIGPLYSVTLSNDTLEFTFNYTTFDHGHPGFEDYYIHLALRNASSNTIVNYEEFRELESNTEYNITLKIPAKYIYAFKVHDSGAFSFNNLRFEEFTIVQLTGPYDELSDQQFNFSYERLAHEETGLNPNSVTTSIDVLQSGDYIDYGLINLHENRSFIIYGNQLTEILKLQVNRTEPPDYSASNFEFSVIDGFGRYRDIWDNDPSSTWVLWRQYWDKTEVSNIFHQIGQYSGPIEFWVKYPDYGWETNPPQKLEVKVEIINDITGPSINVWDPVAGTSFQQYYGIPIKGSGTDDSLVYEYQLVYNNKVQLRYSPFSSGWWGPGPGDSGEFSFVWFPDESITGSLDISIRAIDMVGNVGEISLPIIINPGTKPSPEGTIAKGLEWLRDRQAMDGSWDYFGWPSAGMTALATLCFIQAGLAHDTVVAEAINFLMNAFQDSDDPSVPGKVIWQSGHATYESAMAVTALIAYNATRPSYDSNLNSIIDGAIEWLVATQNDETWGVSPDEPWYGGWRYGYDHQSSDLSVSQWVFLALATYGYDDPDLWNKVQLFVNRCRGVYWENDTWIYDGGFSYTPSTEDWRDFGGGSYGSMTAAGIWGLYLSGVSPDNANITQALDWINSLLPDEIVGQNPHFGKAFEYYWYLSASKAYLMAGRPQDKWWYDMITEYLNTHMIAATETSAYWDNTVGQEPPVMATVEAILSQQVFFGHAPMDRLEITIDSPYGSALAVWNDTWFTGYNYTSAQSEVYGDAQYSTIMAKKQIVTIYSPTKGDYYIDLFPAATKDGFPNQDLILRARALTSDNNLISYKLKTINYQYGNDYPQVLRYKLVYSTVSGVNLEFVDVNPPLFDHVLRLSSITYPDFVNLGESFSIDFNLKHVSSSVLSYSRLVTHSEISLDTEGLDIYDFNPNEERSFTINADTSSITSPGKKIIAITIGAPNTNPLVIRFEVQVGNHAPDGTINPIPSTISGTYNITWDAWDEDNDPLVFTVALELPEGGGYENLTTTTDFYYLFDTTAYTDGSNYGIVVWIFDGTDTTELRSGSFTIDNQEEPTTSAPGLDTPGFELILGLIALTIFLSTKRRKK
ncbi:MAG: prenyltransferase/squalene oxidase repeat-containing protein [Candidatus Hodarchaeales archaeon]